MTLTSRASTEPYYTVAQEEDRRVEMEAPSLFGALVNLVSGGSVVVQSENATEPY